MDTCDKINPQCKDLAEAIQNTAKELRGSIDQAFKPYGMSRSRWLALAILHNEGQGLPQKELAARMGVEGATLVRMLDGMEKDGWVRRRVSPEDRRVNLVEIQDKALSFMTTFEETMRNFSQEIFGGIPEAELRLCTRFLNGLRSRLRDWTPEAEV
ncbi:MarR family winged helix-turn-helix transcriptional regulator [Desulfocurvus sp. DL9XJH121]